MLYEFAVDPESVSDFQNCRYILDHMGVSRGRMIAEFPKRRLWGRLALDAYDAKHRERGGGVGRKRMEEKLMSVGKKMLRGRRDYDQNREWFANAVEQHKSDPFHAVIARDGDLEDGRLLFADSIDENEPLWRVRREDKVPRRADDLAEFVKPLLQISGKIRFVDKLFDPEVWGGKWCPMLEQCLRAATEGDRRPEFVEYHTVISGLKRPTLDELKRRCRKRLPKLLPKGVPLKVVFWRLPGDDESAVPDEYKELIHARYILTNRGGYRVETGLDEGDEGQHQDVSLLDQDLREIRWKELDDGAGVFESAGDIEIQPE